MLRKRVRSYVSSGAAILAGAVAFMGEASAVNVVTETFEGPANLFGLGTYNYSANYTLANTLTPIGGAVYGHGKGGVGGQVSTNTYQATGNPFSLQQGGVTAGLIDSGKVNYNFYAQFSTYMAQNDFGVLTIQFLNGSNAAIGAPITLGSEAFILGLGTGAGGLRAWGADQKTGIVPNGARSLSVNLAETKSAGGTNIDGYIDNINLAVNAIPEPSSALSAALGATLLLFRRNRRAR